MNAEWIPWGALLPVLSALDALGVEHHVGGSVASSLLAVSRATQDVDLVARLEERHAAPLVELLGADYYADETAILASIRRRGSFNLIHLPSMFKVDVFVAREDEFTRENLRRATELEVPEIGRSLRVCSPEDIVLQKLDWYRKGNEVSDRQWGDALAVMRMHSGRLDVAYMRHWASVLGLESILDRLVAAAG